MLRGPPAACPLTACALCHRASADGLSLVVVFNLDLTDTYDDMSKKDEMFNGIGPAARLRGSNRPRRRRGGSSAARGGALLLEPTAAPAACERRVLLFCAAPPHR